MKHRLRLVLLGLAPSLGAQVSAGASSSISLSDYQKHLHKLVSLTEACAAQGSSGASCLPAWIGPDDRVTLPGNPNSAHVIDYAWLRYVFEQANDDSVREHDPKRVAHLLAAAEVRLTRDAQTSGQPEMPALAGDASLERLRAILAAPEFVHVHQQSLLHLLWDRVLAWLFRSLIRMVSPGRRTSWLVPAFWLATALPAAGALLWQYRRHLRRASFAAAASETRVIRAVQPREWESWLAGAEALAQAASWREAIHSLYWAAITRFEAQGRWPRDRARTPREYLALVPRGSAHGDDLALLTRSFEQTWYGSHHAGPSDFEAARSAFVRMERR